MPAPAGSLPETDPTTTPASGRLTSLDWARGWMILTHLTAVSVLAPVPEQLRHPPWLGVTFFDVIFPLFVGLSGCGLAFAYSRRVSPWVTARRAVVLIALGLVYTALVGRVTDVSELRLFGPLQVYGVLTVVVALLHLVLHSVRAWTLCTLGLAMVWSGVFWAYHAQCPTGGPTRSCNLSSAVDLRLLAPGSVYRGGDLGHDPEGVIAMIGCLITMLVGVTAGKVLLARKPPREVVAHLLTWAGTVLVLGLLLMQVVEPFKRLWTPSFAVLTAVVVVGMLILGYLLHDAPATGWWARRRDAWAQPLVALGRNALLMYFGSYLLIHEILVNGDPTWGARIAQLDWPWGHPRLTFVAAFVLGWWLLAWVLHRRRVYLHA